MGFLKAVKEFNEATDRVVDPAYKATAFVSDFVIGGLPKGGFKVIGGKLFQYVGGKYLRKTLKDFVLGEPAGTPTEDEILRNLKKHGKAGGAPQVDQAPKQPWYEKIEFPVLPQLPPRRLKELKSLIDQAVQQTKFKRVQTVQEALSDRTYGKLLHRPITNEKYEVPYSKNMVFWESFAGSQLKRAQQFSKWMHDDRDAITKAGLDHDIYNSGALFITLADKSNKNVETGLIYGVDTMGWMAHNFSHRSEGAHFKVRSTIPTTIKAVPVEKAPTLSRNEYNNLEITQMGIVSKRVGVGEFPVKVPEFLIKSLEEKNIDIDSIPEMLAYLIDQLDGLIGQFPIELQFDDTDLTQEGNQSKTMKVYNISETLAEILGQSMASNINEEALINICLRTLMQAGDATVQAAAARDLAEANGDHLGYERKEIKRKIKMAYTPGKEQLDDILQGSESEIKTIKNTDKRDINDDMAELLGAAAIIRAAFTRKFNANGDIKKQVRDLIQKQLELSGDKSKPKDKKSKADDEWDAFTENVERGWIDKGGISDTLHPYGRNFNERARIKDLGKPPDAK